MSKSNFKDFTVKASVDWFDNNPIRVKHFTYQLAQYLPTVYAEIYLVIDSKYFMSFKSIDKLPIESRTVSVWFEPELYSIKDKKSYFSGPFKFCVVDYTFSKLPITDFNLEYKNINDAMLIKLTCVDTVFYKMTLNQKFKSFGKTTASNVVKQLCQENGAKIKKVVDTDYAFNWLQSQMTDYEMVRSLLPYCRSRSGDLMYSFFLFNNELTFAPISAGQKSPCAIVLNTDKNGEFTYKTGDLKPLVEKYGAKSTLFSTHHGFENFEFVTPQTMKKMSYSKNNRLGKQHSSSSSMYINTGFEDKTLQEIYVSNLRHRIHTFNRLLAFTTEARPELTPIDTIEIINQSSGDLKELDGLYYNAAVKYVFSETNVTQFRPKMSIYLCSEIDANSIESPEGSAI